MRHEAESGTDTPASTRVAAGAGGSSVRVFLEGEYWRDQALTGLIPYWYRHGRDMKYGGLYTTLSRQWEPIPPWEKLPPMISRHAYGFCAAYLLSGESRYLEAARECVDFLLEHAWDKEYGGWFTTLDRAGKPLDTDKPIATQLYTNVGLTMYYFTTGDARALSYVEKSVEIQRTHGHDAEYGGYYETLNRDLSAKATGKNKHAHYGYVSSLLLNLWMATRSPKVLEWERHLTDLTLERMRDPEEGWIDGYLVWFDRQWRRIPLVMEGREVSYIGGQLTAALSLLRLYHQTGDGRYLEQGRALGDKLNCSAWNPERWEWIELVERVHPYRPASSVNVSWWLQIYGCFLQLQLFRVTQDESCMERFVKGQTFWDRHFVDREHGGVFATVSRDGTVVGDGRKAEGWRASYHEMEHALLNYLYLNTYVNKRPAVLHFKLDGGDQPRKHYVSLVDDPSVQVGGVRIDGKPWENFDAAERSVTLPAGRKDLEVEVTLVP